MLTLVLVGIVAAIATSRFFGTQVYDERGFAGKLVSAARYAQQAATSGRCEVRLQVDGAADSFALTYTGTGPGDGTAASCPADGTPVTRPGGGSYDGSAPDGVDIPAGATLVYTPLGRARVVSGTTTLTVGAFQLNFEPETGLAYVAGW